MLSLIFRLALLLACLSSLKIFTVSEDTHGCEYSCPAADETGRVLVKSPYAIGYDKTYSIFDCVYNNHGQNTKPQECHYYKKTGDRALAPTSGSPCPAHAVACSSTTEPQFSAMDKVEEMPWIKPGKDLMWMKENYRNQRPD